MGSQLRAINADLATDLMGFLCDPVYGIQEPGNIACPGDGHQRDMISVHRKFPVKILFIHPAVRG